MFKDDYGFIKTVLIVVIGILTYWCLNNYQLIFDLISTAISVTKPFIIGLGIAYILNIPMSKIEKKLLKKLPEKKGLVRAISIVLSLLLFLAVILIVALLIIPELVENITMLIDSLPALAKKAETFIVDMLTRYPEVQSQIQSLFSELSDFTSVVSSVLSYLASSMVSLASSLFSGFMTTFTSIIFSVYMLSQKEYLIRGCKKVIYALFKQNKADRIMSVCTLSNNTFSRFVTGQCTEVVILGTMMFIACSLFRFPYSVIIAVLTTVTALVPIFGALVAMVVGFVLIAISSPLKAILFIVVFQVVQQIENNFIYPKVVGKSVGLYPIWTLFAITVGGNLFGVIGMLVGLPIASVLYTLFTDYINKRLKEKDIQVA